MAKPFPALCLQRGAYPVWDAFDGEILICSSPLPRLFSILVICSPTVYLCLTEALVDFVAEPVQFSMLVFPGRT